MDIKSVLPGTQSYERVRGLVRRHNDGLTNYDTIAVNYNNLPAHGILLLDMKNSATLGNIARVLYGRGVERNIDYTLQRLREDSKGIPIPPQKRPLAIERLTMVDMLVKQA